MKIINTGYPLKMRKAFVTILETELTQSNTASGEVILSFKHPDYSAERGGYYPVEIAIDSAGRIGYITDFSYVGTAPFIELAKQLDFDFSLEVFQQFGRDYPMHLGKELFQVWQKNFCAYYDSGVYHVSITQEG